MRERDWAKTPLGPVKSWPQNLKICIRILLTSRQPMFVWWGDDLINLYNDAYKAVVGGKHPAALGQPASVVWREIWDQVSPRAESVMRANEGTYDEALLLVMERYGYREETYYTFSFSPVPNDQGGTGGIFCANSDDTQRVIAERQLAVLADLGAKTGEAKSWQEAGRRSASSLASNPRDLCFSLIYVVDDSRKQAVLAGLSGIDAGHPAAPAAIPLAPGGMWPIAEALASNETCIVHGVDSGFENLPKGAWDRPPHSAAVLPIAAGSGGRAAALVVGLNPYRVLDDQYTNFLKLVATQISSGIANAEAYEQERRQEQKLMVSEKLAATGRLAATVAHEINNPLESVLNLLYLARISRSAPPEKIGEYLLTAEQELTRVSEIARHTLGFYRDTSVPANIEIPGVLNDVLGVYRSRLNANRIEVVKRFEPVPPLHGLRGEMHQVFSNLVSNAIDAMQSGGRLSVSLSRAGRQGSPGVEVIVEDSGHGIPLSHRESLFEPFFTTKVSVGTGLGLWVVKQFVEEHQGTVTVESSVAETDHGTKFVIFLPFEAITASISRAV
jgi:signal transduction histidine kinase